MTLSIYWRTWTKGDLVGTDDLGNRYYRQKHYTGYWKNEPRWVLYKGLVNGSKIPALWASWLHHTVQFPINQAIEKAAWQKPHLPNLTGTRHAFHPSESPSIRRSFYPYTAWTPKKPPQKTTAEK